MARPDGPGPAGLYTYARLEQLVGAAIRSADTVVPELQQLAVGDTILLSPVGGPKVAILDPAHAPVLYETMDLRTGSGDPACARHLLSHGLDLVVHTAPNARWGDSVAGADARRLATACTPGSGLSTTAGAGAFRDGTRDAAGYKASR